jgi:uncharacterized protein YhdP
MIIRDASEPRRPAKASPLRRWGKRSAISLIALLLLLIGLRAALPVVVLHIVNGKLNSIPEYRGRIGDVDMALFRGAYRIQDIRLEKIEGASAVPFFSADLVDLSVEWRALLHGAFVGEARIDKPRLNFVVAETKKASQTGIDASWKERAKEIFPLDLNRVELHDGEIHYRDVKRSPKVDIYLDKVDAVARGLTTRPKEGETLPANLHATARAMDLARMNLDVKLDPLAKRPTFDMKAELVGLPLPSLNDFLRAYAGVDAEGGTFSLYTEMAANEGRFKGYVKPIAKDVRIFSPGKEPHRGFMATAWEALVAGVKNILENRSKDRSPRRSLSPGSSRNRKRTYGRPSGISCVTPSSAP